MKDIGLSNPRRVEHLTASFAQLLAADFRDPDPLAILQRRAVGEPVNGNERDRMQAVEWSREHPGVMGHIVLADDVLAFSAGGNRGAYFCVVHHKGNDFVFPTMAIFCEPITFALGFFAGNGPDYWPGDDGMLPDPLGITGPVGRTCPCRKPEAHQTSPSAAMATLEVIFLAIHRFMEEFDPLGETDHDQHGEDCSCEEQ